MGASGAQQHYSYFLRVCCLRACSRWRVPILDPAPMEKVGVDEPGSRKVAQVSAALGSVRSSPWEERKAQHPTESMQVPPEQSPRAHLALPLFPVQGDTMTHELPKAGTPTPSLPKEVPTPPKLEAGVLGVLKERVLLPLPMAPGTGVPCPKVGTGAPGKQNVTVSQA